jgi:hypothetical protein
MLDPGLASSSLNIDSLIDPPSQKSVEILEIMVNSVELFA